MHWAEITEFLGRDENFQTGTPSLFCDGGQQIHEYGKLPQKLKRLTTTDQHLSPYSGISILWAPRKSREKLL